MSDIEKVKSIISRQIQDIYSISGINSLLLSVCLVDTLAGFYCGYNGQKSGNRDRYKKFSDRYLPDYCEVIYQIRCDLTHSFSNTLSKYYFTDNSDLTSCFGNNIKILEKQTFNIDHFRDSLQEAIEKYFFDLATSGDLQTNFSTRYSYSGILDSGQIGTVRTLSGKMVSDIEELDSLPGLDLKIGIADPIKTRQ